MTAKDKRIKAVMKHYTKFNVIRESIIIQKARKEDTAYYSYHYEALGEAVKKNRQRPWKFARDDRFDNKKKNPGYNKSLKLGEERK